LSSPTARSHKPLNPGLYAPLCMESSGCDANQGSEALSPGKRELAPEIQGPTQLRLGRAQLKRTEMVGGYAGEVIASGLSAEQKTAG
jgi:hypothetical protein